VIEVRLSWGELQVGAFAGVMRRVVNLHDGHVHRWRYDAGEDWQIGIEGTLAELAVAKALDRYWTPVARYGRDVVADVGRRYQVRSTPRLDGCLIVHDDDPDDHLYVLVVGTAPELRIVGCILGDAAKRPEFWRTDVRFPAYFVPQVALDDLTQEVRE
jgi:hypothetical protein